MAKQLKKTNVVAGRIIPVANLKRKLGANPWYYAVWVEDADGKRERPILLTANQLRVADARAKANPEDCPRKGWLVDLLD